MLAAVIVASSALAGCAGGDPAAEPPGDPTAESTPASTEAALSPAVQCLVDGSPWSLSTTDLQSQIPGVLRGLDVVDARVDGSQTIEVGPDLLATIVDDRLTTITVDLGGGLTMVATQTHAGTTSGRWRVEGDKLVPEGAWQGGIEGSTVISVNGETADAPFSIPDSVLGAVPMTFSCDGALDLVAEGSPYVYLFQ